MTDDLIAKIEQIYKKFRTEYYSGKYKSVHEALRQISVEERSPHSMEKFIIFYSKPIINPRIMLIGNNPSFFHQNLTDIANAETGLTLAESNLNDVAECIPEINSYMSHEHKFAIQLQEIFKDICHPNWLNDAVGLNSFFLQTGGKGLTRLKCLSDAAEFKQIKQFCTQLTKNIITLLQPKLVIFIGSEASQRFPQKEFPRSFNASGTSFMDIAHPANRRGGSKISSNDIKIWFDNHKEACHHIK